MSHGNITTLGDVSFTYDSLDRHVSTVLPNGSTITLERDIDGSVLTRTVTGPNPEVVKYSSGVVEFFLDGNKYVTGTALSLPGGVTVTTVGTAATSTFTSLQGHACLTSTATSTTRTRFDPFGTPLTALPDTVPGTSEPGFGTGAGIRADTITPYGIIDMGARLYSAVLGRFLQVDPVPGGGVNAFVYPPDPVNMNDYSGRVATADAFASWTKHGANPSRDGNLRKVRAPYASDIELGLIFTIAIATIGAIALGAFALPELLTVVAITEGVAFLSGTAAMAMACSREILSFDCVTGMLGTSLGVAGRGAQLFSNNVLLEGALGSVERSISISGIFLAPPVVWQKYSNNKSAGR